MKRFLLGIFAILLSVPFAALFAVSSVNAASSADTTIEITDKLEIGNSSNPIDITTSYAGVIQNECSTEAYDDFIANINNNGYQHITQSKYTNIDYYQVSIMMAENSSGIHIEYSDSWPYGSWFFSPSNTGIKTITLSTDGCSYTNYQNGSIAGVGIYENPKTYPFLSTFPINYPENYEGEIIPETWSPPIEPTTIYPIVAWNYSGEKRLFATGHIDPELCIPIKDTDGCYNKEWLTIKWQLIDTSDNSILKEKITSHWSEKFEYDDINIGDTLILKAKFLENTPIPYQPIDSSVTLGWVEFEINTIEGTQSGSQYIQTCITDNSTMTCESPKQFKECFQNTFPYVDMPSCVWNAQRIIEILTFDRIKLLPYAPTNTNGCVQLTKLGDWINLPNETVCPYFPKEVRDTITPFITTALAILIITFISRISRSNI